MDYLAVNRESWNQRTTIHVESKFYNVERFLAGHSTLNDIELNALGDVSGKTLLHLQCHFGLDTLSWARAGAKVTGVDLSPVAIEKAQQLALQSGLDAEFVCSDVCAFKTVNRQRYDIVYTSYGVLCWLPNLTQWAKTVAESLRPGGLFYLAEFHPVADLLSGYRYFHHAQPDVEDESTYTENATSETTTVVTWPHSVSDVISALLNAGVTIAEFNELPYCPYPCYEGLQERESGRYYLKHQGQDVPMLYTIKGIKG